MNEHEHWHVMSGLSGYLPNTSDVVDDVEAAAALVRDILDREADDLDSAARFYAEPDQGEPDYAAAWKAHAQSERLSMLVMNLDPQRAHAPLYVDDVDLYRLSLGRILRDDADGVALDVDEYRRLSVYECSFDECAPADEDDEDES